MDVEGLAANGPGDKSKVFGMQEGSDDFITNDYRVDIQYRGVNGFPPNAIQWRVIYGDAEDLDVRYEPTTAQRMASVVLLSPSTTYHWKFNWGPEIRLVVARGRHDRQQPLRHREARAQRYGTRLTRTSPTSGAPVGRSGD